MMFLVIQFFYYRRNELKDEWEMIKWKHQALKSKKRKTERLFGDDGGRVRSLVDSVRTP